MVIFFVKTFNAIGFSYDLYSKTHTDDHFEKVKVNDYFMDCVEENQAELEIANIRMEFFSNAEEHVQVMADREQLHRVMNNLIGNAVKYRGSKEEGLIVIPSSHK